MPQVPHRKTCDKLQRFIFMVEMIDTDGFSDFFECFFIYTNIVCCVRRCFYLVIRLELFSRSVSGDVLM